MERLVYTVPQRALRLPICSTCLRSLRRRQRPLPKNATPQRRWQHIARKGEQAMPHSGFYAEMLDKPVSDVQPATRTTPAPPPQDELPKTDREQVLSKARVVFGSRLAGPAERARELEAASHNIAGILVPPKPTEPDNCCMSGCVNCVWDRFRDELEDWAEKSAQARARLLEQRQRGEGSGMMVKEPGMPSHVATSMDDDGGGSETNWASGVELSGQEGDLFQGIPVGIREFMRTEKKLREKHRRERTVGG